MFYAYTILELLSYSCPFMPSMIYSTYPIKNFFTIPELLILPALLPNVIKYLKLDNKYFIENVIQSSTSEHEPTTCSWG